MIYHLLTLEYGLELLGVALVSAILLYAVRFFEKQAGKRELGKTVHISYFSNLLSNTFMMLTILIPLLIAVTTSLFTANQSANYSTLLACITCLIGVLIVALWFNFSLPSFSSNGDDRIVHTTQSKSAVGLIYGLTIASILLGVCYFLFEYTPAVAVKTQTSSEILLYRPRLSLDLTREQVEKLWGQPLVGSREPYSYNYFTPKSLVSVQFNAEGKMTSLTETRREK